MSVPGPEGGGHFWSLSLFIKRRDGYIIFFKGILAKCNKISNTKSSSKNNYFIVMYIAYTVRIMLCGGFFKDLVYAWKEVHRKLCLKTYSILVALCVFWDVRVTKLYLRKLFFKSYRRSQTLTTDCKRNIRPRKKMYVWSHRVRSFWMLLESSFKQIAAPYCTRL